MSKIDRIKFVERSNLDVLKYDQLVDSFKGVSIYCYSWYMDIVSDNWGCLVLGEYELILPLAYTIKFGQKMIYQPFFTREFAFLGSVTLSNEIILSFLSAIPKGIKSVNLSLSNHVNPLNYSVEEFYNQELNLNEEYDKISLNYSKNSKRLIKKAIKVSYSIQESNLAAEFVKSFQEDTGDRVNYSKEHYKKLEMLIQKALDKNMCRLFQIKLDDDIIAQGVFLIQDHRVTYLKGTVSVTGKKTGAMHYIMNHAISTYSNRDIIFDFGGSRIDSIASFYHKFGAKNRSYFQYSKNDLSFLLKKGKILRDFLKK